MAEKALAERRYISTRENFLRASSYYRAVEFYAPWDRLKRRELWRKSWDCFRRAAPPLLDPPVEPLEIPFEGRVYQQFLNS